MSEGQRTAVWQRLCALIETQAGGDQTDGQLLERYAVHCEAAAFAALVRRHGPMVFGLCRRVLRDHHQAEDAFQATFLVLVRKAASLDRRRPLGNWLYTIAYHAALKTRAAGARRVQREAAVARPEGVEPRDEVEATELRQLLDAELHRLPEKYRAPVVLCYLQGRTNEEAAQELGWPSGTVKGRLARARDLLRDRLTRRGLTLSYAVFAAALAEPATAANLPPGLAERTVEVASAFADNIVSAAPAAAIAKGVLRAMILTKVKTAALVLATVLIASGIGFLLLPARAETTPIAAPAPDKPKDDDAAAKLPEAKGQRLPLDAVKSGNVLGDKEARPAVTLGVLEPGKQTEPRDLSSDFFQNRLTITNPKAGQLVSLMVVSPELTSSEDANLEMLTRDGNVFTLVMSVWQDDTKKFRGYIVYHKKLFINVPLGTLDAGKYEFRFVYQSLFKETAKPQPWYVFKSAKFASVPFTVAKADDTEIGKAVLLKYSDLCEPKGKPADLGAFRQFPRPQFHALGPAAQTEIAAHLGLQVGTFDRDKWWATEPKTVGDLPKLHEPEAGDAVYASLLSPYLQSLEWMSLRAIEWKDKEAILHVDIWQDQGVRTANVMAAHHLVVPLQTPGKLVDGKWQTAPGEYRVRVKWNFLRADNYPTPGLPYTPQDSDKLLAKDPLASLLGHSEAKFTIPPGAKDVPDKLPEAKGQSLRLDGPPSLSLRDAPNVTRSAVTLGRLVPRQQGTPLQDFADRKLEMIGPKAGEPVSAIVVGPGVGDGEHTWLTTLTRDQNVFTLVMDVWQDDPQHRAINHRDAHQLSLGTLDAGGYELRVIRRNLIKTAVKGQPWYEFQSATTASLPFTVARNDNGEVGKSVLLDETAFRAPKDKPSDVGSVFQHFQAMMTRFGGGVEAPSGLAVGTFDLKKFVKNHKGDSPELPNLAAPAGGDPVYATILSPPLNSGEAMTLRDVEWKGKDVILHVEIWRDNGERTENAHTRHFLVVPLNAPPGDYRVKVEWTFLLARTFPAPGELYTTQDPAKLDAADPFKAIEKRSQAKLTIPPPDQKAPAPPPEVGEKRVSLADMNATQLTSEKRPALTLGLVTDKGDPLKAFADGKLQIEGPRAGLTTAVFAVSPVLNSGENANVVSVTRDKNAFTLVMDVWQDDFARKKNIVHRKAFQVSLGELAVGDYEIRLVQRHLRMDDETEPWYKLKSESAGTMKFFVHEPPETILTNALVLPEDKLKDVKDAKGFGTYRQYPECDTKRLPSALLVTTPRVEVGTFDRKALQTSTPKQVADLPKVQVPEKGDPVYLTILGSEQNSGEGLTLREIEWKDKEAIVRVDLWHDNGDRAENMIGWTHLTIPLHAPPGDYRVRVQWNFLLAPRYPESGQPYALEDATKFGEKEPFKDFEKRSELKVTIK